MTKKITKAQCQKMAAKIVRENPDQLNPVNFAGGCVYQNYSKTNTKRCIVGQTFHEFGLPVPGPTVYKSVDELTKRYTEPFTESALGYLHKLQGVADNATECGIPWGKIGSVYEPESL